MKLQKWISVLLTVLLLLSLVGCGAEAPRDSANQYGGATMDMGMAADKEAEESPSLSENGNAPALPENQKMVRKVWLEAETEELDSLLSSVEQRISQLGGYIEKQNTHNGSAYATHRSRYAELTVRIPADRLDEFVTNVSEASNIVSKEQTAENITLSYVATESRVKALETEQTRLLELLAKAETMEDILKIESKLTDIRTELEEVTSKLRVYDNMVDYGTIYLTINEVRQYTVVEEEPETVWERISTGFVENAKDLWNGITELFIFLVTGLPYFIPLGLVVTVFLLILRRKPRKKATPVRKAESKPESEA